MHERRDYDTISCGVLDDMIASLALQNKEKIFDRNRSILLKNREILDKWVEETEGAAFEMEGAVRIGYAFDSELLREGLDKFAEFLNENR